MHHDSFGVDDLHPAGRRFPDELVKLELHPHRQRILEDPPGKELRVDPGGAGDLEALGLREDFVDQIIEYRQDPEGNEGTDESGVFHNLADITALIPNRDPGQQEGDDAGTVNMLAGVNSKYFRVFVTSKTKDGKIVKKVEAVVSRNEDDRGVRFWREY